MLTLEARDRIGAAIHRDHAVTGILQRPGKIGAHGLVVFGKEDADHFGRSSPLLFCAWVCPQSYSPGS